MLQTFLTFAVIAILMFVGLKLVFWANALILLGLMQRRIRRRFWRFTIHELSLAICSAVSFSVLTTFDGNLVAFGHRRLFFSLMFMFATLAYLIYMMKRAWQDSEKEMDY